MLVIKAREHEPIAVPATLILNNDRLDLFSNLGGEKLFRIKLRAEMLEIQPTGYIGFIPLNNRVAIEVEPRMPIANVEHLLARSEQTPALTLPYLRSFSEAPVQVTPFAQLLAARYAALLHELRVEGVYKTYNTRQHVGPNPSGRIQPLATALRSRFVRRAIAVYERFDRTADNAPNRLIVAAGRKLLRSTLFAGGSETKLRNFIEQGLEFLEGINEVSEPEVPHPDTLPYERPSLSQLVAVSGVILRGQGIRLRGEGSLRLPTFLIKMEDVFEAYVRIVLQESQALAEFQIQDGNKGPPIGAARQLFLDPGILGNRGVTPDIVVLKDSLPVCVVEVKYKPCERQPDRDNLNQLLTYALTYNVKNAMLLYPAMERQVTGVTRLGIVQGIECFKVILDLSSEQIENEEAKLCSAIRLYI